MENLKQKNCHQLEVLVVQSLDENHIKGTFNAILVKPEVNPYYEDSTNKIVCDVDDDAIDKYLEKIKVVENAYYE